jgi:hypothetical protein
MTCSTCRHFRQGVVAGLGYCAMDRRREVLRGDEIRACWQSAVEGTPPLGLFGAERIAVADPGWPSTGPDGVDVRVAADARPWESSAAPPHRAVPVEPRPRVPLPIAPLALTGPAQAPEDAAAGRVEPAAGGLREAPVVTARLRLRASAPTAGRAADASSVDGERHRTLEH